MISLFSQSVGSLWLWTRRHPYFLFGAPILLVLSISFCLRTDSEWEDVYVVAAHHLRQGTDIYTDGNSYPPFAALTALPASFLSPLSGRITWLLVNLACVLVMVCGAWRLAGGAPLQGNTKVPFGEHLAAVGGFLCGAFYVLLCLAHQQTDLVIGALLVAGCLALQRSRSLLGATCFGIAAALKCTPLIWVPYLLWRGRPVAALWLLCVALSLNLLPNLISSPASGQLWLTEYVTRYLRPLAASDHVVGTWASDIMYNQSVSGAGQRWFVNDRENPVRPEVLRGGVLAIECALVLLTLWIHGRPFQRHEPRVENGINREAIEYGAVLTLMLLLSPMSSKAHFGILIVPGFLLARAAATTRNWLLWCCLLTCVLLGVFSNKDSLGEDLYTLTLWYGTVMWQTLLLLGGSLMLARQFAGSKVHLVANRVQVPLFWHVKRQQPVAAASSFYYGKPGLSGVRINRNQEKTQLR